MPRVHPPAPPPAPACPDLSLGRLEDLPPSYLQALSDQNLVPLWPSLRSLLPPHTPQPRTQPAHWPYASLRPLLMQAGELTPMDKAERRVLVLANPGHGPNSLQASAAMYLGMQLLLPGEWAPAHRHTPNAVRMVVEGEGAYTTVDGQRCPMQRGDLILTPTGLWHEHGHDGSTPVTWLDVLDLPLMHHLEVSYHVNGPRQSTLPGQAEYAYAGGGVAPAPGFERQPGPYPVLRYPWQDTRAALEALALARPDQEAVQVSYINPETGRDAENVLGFYALMLRPGQHLRLPVRSPALVLHLIESANAVSLTVLTEADRPARHPPRRYELRPADTACAPGFSEITLHNPAPSDAAYLFLADEAPLHRKLGVYEVRA